MRTVSRGQLDFLLDEIEVWIDDGVVSQEQAARIRSMYRVKSRSFAQILLSSGALLVGLGAICAVAANWEDIPRLVRFALVVGAYIASVLASFISIARGMERLSRSLMLLASMVFGAGIFLIAQMYNYGGHWTTAVGWWIAGIMPVAWIFRDRWQVFLIQGLSVCYLGGLDFLLWSERVQKTFLRWEGIPAVAILLLWFLWIRLRRDGSVFNVNVLVTGQFLFSRLADRVDPVTAMILFFVVGTVSMLVFHGDGEWQESAVWWGIIISGVIGLILSIPESWNSFTWIGSARTSLSGALPFGLSSADQALAAGAACMTAVAMALRLYMGGHLAGVFLVLLALRYFVDHFFGFMSKAAAFGALGALCIIFGVLWERRLRKKGAAEHD